MSVNGRESHLDGGLGQGPHAHEPLLAHKRLNDLTAPLGARHPHLVHLVPLRKALLLHCWCINQKSA